MHVDSLLLGYQTTRPLRDTHTGSWKAVRHCPSWIVLKQMDTPAAGEQTGHRGLLQGPAGPIFVVSPIPVALTYVA